ncbi:MAG: tetratricopeptide repeat protein [bacterium]
MIKRNLVSFALCLCLAPALYPVRAVAQDAAGHEIQTLRNLEEAIKNSETLLSKYSDKDFTATLMFQLSELYLKRATMKFQREMLIYEQAEEKFNQGLSDTPPEVPRVDFSQTINISLKLLAKYPAIHFRDKLLYRVALCYSQEGEQDKAAEYFKLLSEETEEEALLEEAHFRLGEYYFEHKDYTATIDYYSLLLESWDSPFFDMALYKLGWAYYNINDFTRAISTFIYLIEDIDILQDVEAHNLGKSRADLRQEAIEYVAICFAEYGGPEKARDFLKEKKGKDYTEEVLSHLATIYQQRNFYDEAITTLQTLIDFYPDQPTAVQYQRQIVENHELAGDKEQADLERAVLVEGYGPGSEWFQRIPDGPARQEILNIAETFLYTLGSEAQELAQASGALADYEIAIGWYSDYMKKFPTFERAHKVQFYLAECTYEIGNYLQAATAYYDLLLNYPESEFGETAAYNRILAYNHLLRSNNTPDSTDFFLFNFLGKEQASVEIIKAQNGHQAQLMQACHDFFVYHPRSPKVNEVLMNFAQILFELEQYKLAKQVYAEVMLEPAGNPYLTQAYSLMAQCEFQQENYDAAESWFMQIRELFPDSTRYVARANKMIASSRFRRAELYLTGGDSGRAAEAFVKVAETAPDSAIAERAHFEAAKQFEQLGKPERAIALYEAVPLKFPGASLQDEALFKAGILCEGLEQWERAATNYLKLYEHDRFSEYAAGGLFSAARCYETAHRYGEARKYYHEYTESYVQDPDRFLEAAFRKAEIAYGLEDFENALDDLRFVLRSYQDLRKEKVQVDNYFAANSQFLIAEISYKAFRKIKLEVPLERTLKRKQTLFRRVLKAYTHAAKFKVAEWTTASSYKIGQTFEEFADALLAAPQPKNLSANDRDQYNRTLWERVLPFKEKARKAYETNVKNARENGIQNRWIMESEKRLSELSLELGLGAAAPHRDDAGS